MADVTQTPASVEPARTSLLFVERRSAGAFAVVAELADMRSATLAVCPNETVAWMVAHALGRTTPDGVVVR